MPFNPKFTITPKINKAIVEIECVRGFLDAVKLKDDWLADMQKEALILKSRIQHIISCLILYTTGYDFKRLFTISEYYDKDSNA